MFQVVILLVLAVVSLGQESTQMVQESEPATMIPDLLRPSILRELPKPFLPGEFPHYYHPYRRYRYHPYHPYHFQHYRTHPNLPSLPSLPPSPPNLPNLPKLPRLPSPPNHPSREDGKGVAVHPGGATSYVFPQVHGVGKRSADAKPDPGHAYSYMSRYHHPYYYPYNFYRYPYRPFGPYYHNRHHLDKRSTPGGDTQYSFGYPSDLSEEEDFFNLPLGSHYGYSYRW